MTNTTNAIKQLHALTTHDTPRHDANRAALRELLIAESDADELAGYDDLLTPDTDDIIELVSSLFSDPYARDAISHLAMQFSLCPHHFRDWAICFDDNDPSCAQIRAIFPHEHDS